MATRGDEATYGKMERVEGTTVALWLMGGIVVISPASAVCCSAILCPIAYPILCYGDRSMGKEEKGTNARCRFLAGNDGVCSPLTDPVPPPCPSAGDLRSAHSHTEHPSRPRGQPCRYPSKSHPFAPNCRPTRQSSPPPPPPANDPRHPPSPRRVRCPPWLPCRPWPSAERESRSRSFR